MNLLVKQGICYFFTYVVVYSLLLSSPLPSNLAKSPTELMVSFRYSEIFLSALLDIMTFSGNLTIGGWSLTLMFVLQYVPIFTLAHRFIMSIRELYAYDVQGRRGGRIDTGFGLSFSDRGAVGTVLVFADVEPNEGSADVEEILLEVGTTQE
ncbi:hypothetical protein OG21DRAFT_1511989 [Imleria badia]|nr:hypothetical protein OG21DRAFT_1511989 [Imleria badia]